MTTEIAPFLELMVERQASDLYFNGGAPVNIKVEGVTEPVDGPELTPVQVKELAYSLMSDDQMKVFEEELEMDLGVTVKNIGRFRINVYRQRGEVALVVRYIRSRIPGIEELNLPPLLNDLVMEPRGLILVVGPAGSGKSTTLAAMIEHRSRNRSGHILTIEDPVEYLHGHHRSVISQREVGFDTLSYPAALRRAMRQAPDVILIGEIRDRETMEQAISYANTGHLCLSTLHATNANQTLDRIINFFPDSAHHQLFMDLALNLTAIISQRLVIGRDGARLPAVELLLNSPYVSELIQRGEVQTIREAMIQSTDRGMQTFDQALFNLYREGRISREEALGNAQSRNNLGLRIRLEESGRAVGQGEMQIDEDRPKA
ncbi:MAG: PilT/PilU family type 4a pilus ATPase [Chromatiales bacterium]